MQMEYNKALSQQKRDKESKNKYDETNMDTYNIQEAENTRSTVYSKLKDEIESSKLSI